jgi:putative hydrolase of the HAD superfamily
VLKAIFFDAAGTLFEPREPVGSTYARIARAYGVNATDEAVSAGFRRVFHHAAGLAFGPNRNASELRILEYRWWHELVAASFEGLGTFTDFDAYFEELFAYFAEPDHWQLDPEAPPMLRYLQDRGFGLGMISNFDYRLYRILDGLGLSGYFQSVTISSEAGYAKPAKEIFIIALGKHHAAPEAAMHVGDAEHLDVVGANNAGIAAVLLDPSASLLLRIEDRTGRIPSLASVAEVVRRWALP